MRRVDGYETETLIQRILSEYQGLESDFLDFNTFLTQIKQKEKSKQTDTIINQLVQQIDSIPKRQSKLLQELQQISEFTGSPSFETLNSEQISHSYDLINAIRYNHFAALELPWDPSHFTKVMSKLHFLHYPYAYSCLFLIGWIYSTTLTHTWMKCAVGFVNIYLIVSKNWMKRLFQS